MEDSQACFDSRLLFPQIFRLNLKSTLWRSSACDDIAAAAQTYGNPCKTHTPFAARIVGKFLFKMTLGPNLMPHTACEGKRM